MILISPRILNSAQKQQIAKDSFESDSSEGRVKVKIINDEMMTDDYLLDSIESQQMNPRTIGRSGSFVEDEIGYTNKNNNSSF